MRRKPRLFVFLGCLLASFLAGGCGHGKEQAPTRLEKFDFLIDWHADATHLGVYHARDLGLFQKLGLEMLGMGSHPLISA